MELLAEGKWREDIALSNIPVASASGSSSSGSLILREFSRESSSHKNGNTKLKTHTEDGARIIANGRVYRQIFEDQVHLVAELDRTKNERINKDTIQKVRSSRDVKMPSVQNKTQHGFLDKPGRQWVDALPNSVSVANPVIQRQLQNERHWTEKRSDRFQCSQEVFDLPDVVRPAKVGSDIIDRITEKRREKHNETMEEMHQSLATITLRLEPRITSICDKLRIQLESNDKVIEELINRIETDAGLLSHSKPGLINLWIELAQQADVRRTWINETDEELAEVEEERIREIRKTMSDYANKLEKTSHIAPAHLHRLIDDEAMDINNTLLSNRRAFADLNARLLMADIDRERRNRAWWNKRLDDWKRLNTENAVSGFSDFMNSPERVNPPSIEKIMETLWEEQSALNDARSKLLLEIKDALCPPRATKTYVYQWNQNVVSISKQIDQVNQNFLKSLFEEYERVSQSCLAQMDKMRAELVSAGACTDDQVEQVIKERCIPLIGQRQREFETKLEEIDKEFEKLNIRASTQLKSLFKFSQGIAHIWDRHELGLAGQERKLHERMEASRHSHDMQNQEKEASLDMIMDKMRQESNEAGLKDCLKKALDMLEKIRAGYHRFYEHQEHIAKGYPGMIDDEMDSYDRALCRFFGLSKEAQPVKKKKKNTRAPIKRKPTRSSSTLASRETSDLSAKQKQPVSDSEIRTETDALSEAPEVGLSTESTALDLARTEGEPEEDAAEDIVEEDLEEQAEKEKKSRAETKPTPANEEDLVSRAFKEILTTSKGTQFYVLSVAGKYGIPPDPEVGESGEQSGSGPGYIQERTSTEASLTLPSYIDVVNLPENLLMEIKKQIRQNFLEHLDEWRTESLQRARKVVVAKCEELDSELKLRLHLHEPRPRRTEFDVHNVRAAELVLHNERVTRHCKGIVQLLTELRNDFSNMNEEHNRLVEQFRADIETMEEVFINATKSTKLVSLVSQLGEEVNKFMNVIRVSLREFRQKLDEKLAMLREANARFIKSFKLFSEGGNFCPEEVEEYRKRLEKMSHKIDASESGILSDLEGMEKKRLEQAHKISQEFEDRFKHHMVDLLFMEKVARWLTNTQVKIKAEVADSNSQAQKLAQTLVSLDRRIDACEHPNVDKESVTAGQLSSGLNDIFQAFHDRSLYLNCVKTQMRPPSPSQQQPAPTSSARVVFSEPTPISRAGKQPNEDASINVIKTILKTQRQRNQAPDEAGDQGQEDSAKVRRKLVQSKEGTVRPSVTAGGAGLGSNEAMSVAQMVPGESNSRQPSVQGSHGGAENSPSKRTSRRGSTSTVVAGEGKRAASASRRYVAKNQRLDKKYLVFGSIDPDGMSMEIANENTHFLGRVKKICREALDGMLLAAELYYRQKGARNVTRPTSLQETFDQCADIIIAKLQSYYQQADEYHNNCLQELRDQLDKLERSIAEVPRIVIAIMSRHVLDQCRQDMSLVDSEFEKKGRELENQRRVNEENLRPSLGHPNENQRLEDLCSLENNRHEQMIQMNAEHKAHLRQCVGDCGQRFAENLSSLSEQMLLQFDNLLTVDDVERGRKDPTRHPTSELIRRKQSGAPLEDDETKTLIPRGKTTWPGLKLTEFVLDEIYSRPGAIKPRSVAAAVVSAKTTMGHNATVEARDSTYLDFRQHFQEFLRQIEDQIRQFELSEQRWNENWMRSVQRVKELV